MTGNQPRQGTVSDLINRLLDKGYAQAAEPVLRAIASSTSTGLIKQRLDELDAEVARLVEAGERLTPDNPVLRALLADLETTLNGDATIIGSASESVQSSGSTAAGTIQRQLALGGTTDAQLARIGVRWNAPDPEAVARLIGYARSDPWAAALSKYGTDILGIVNNQAIQGIALGWSPLRTAREIRRMTENLPAHQANNLMRTLQLTSYRDSTALHQNANRSIAQQVVRIAARDLRTCLSCIAQHGDVIWDAERDGGDAPVPRVDDHHSGRCTAVIIVKGFPRTIQTGQQWWDSLPPERQAQQVSLVRSPGKLEALRDGKATLRDFIHPYSDDVFGRMVRESSLKDILGGSSGGGRSGGGGSPPTVQTVNGIMPSDSGSPGDSPDSLNNFITNSQGPLSEAFKDMETAVVYQDFNTDQWVVDPENTRTAARRFVQESQNIQYGKDYILSLVQQQAAQSGVNVDLKGAEQLYNDFYKHRAVAIQTAANIGGVILTEAQTRRLGVAAQGQYLNMVYTTQSSLAGSLANQTKREVKYGGNTYATDAARRAARREFLSNMGFLDES